MMPVFFLRDCFLLVVAALYNVNVESFDAHQCNLCGNAASNTRGLGMNEDQDERELTRS